MKYDFDEVKKNMCRLVYMCVDVICVYIHVHISQLLFSFSVVSDSFVSTWTVTCQDPLSMGFPRQEQCCRLPCPSLGDLSDPGIKPRSPALADEFFTAEPNGKPTLRIHTLNKNGKKKCFGFIYMFVHMCVCVCVYVSLALFVLEPSEVSGSLSL